MKRLLTFCGAMFALGAGVAAANDIVVGPVYTPLVAPPPVGQSVYYGPVVGPVAGPVGTTTYYAPAPAVVAPAPVVTYRPMVVRPGRAVVAYSPVIAPAVAYGPPPVYAYSPAYSPVVPAPYSYSPVGPAPVYAAPAPMMVPVGRPVVVSTKVYVPWQPVRNFFKAITP